MNCAAKWLSRVEIALMVTGISFLGTGFAATALPLKPLRQPAELSLVALTSLSVEQPVARSRKAPSQAAGRRTNPTIIDGES